MKKRIPKSGYRVLAIVWTLAAASMAVAFVRYLPVEFNLPVLLLLALSTLAAANFWRTYHNTPGESGPDPFAEPPKFADDPVLFDDDPPSAARPNKDSEENDHER